MLVLRYTRGTEGGRKRAGLCEETGRWTWQVCIVMELKIEDTVGERTVVSDGDGVVSCHDVRISKSGRRRRRCCCG